jgi:hypothetical protein
MGPLDSVNDTAPLPAEVRGPSQPSPICVKCAHDLMLCDCEGQEHGENVAFMCQDAVPAGAPVRAHLERFVAEVEAHPLLQQTFHARQLVNDFLQQGPAGDPAGAALEAHAPCVCVLGA